MPVSRFARIESKAFARDVHFVPSVSFAGLNPAAELRSPSSVSRSAALCNDHLLLELEQEERSLELGQFKSREKEERRERERLWRGIRYAQYYKLCWTLRSHFQDDVLWLRFSILFQFLF